MTKKSGLLTNLLMTLPLRRPCRTASTATPLPSSSAWTLGRGDAFSTLLRLRRTWGVFALHVFFFSRLWGFHPAVDVFSKRLCDHTGKSWAPAKITEQRTSRRGGVSVRLSVPDFVRRNGLRGVGPEAGVSVYAAVCASRGNMWRSCCFFVRVIFAVAHFRKL